MINFKKKYYCPSCSKELMFIKVFWRIYKFNDKEYDKTCLYILDEIPFNLFGYYLILPQYPN
jgi:hypothetical protein